MKPIYMAGPWITDHENMMRTGWYEKPYWYVEHDERIHFSAQLPPRLPQLDIIYLSSALQYVEDYGTLLKTLAGYEAKYFFWASFRRAIFRLMRRRK
jgi:hypothetical protein